MCFVGKSVDLIDQPIWQFAIIWASRIVLFPLQQLAKQLFGLLTSIVWAGDLYFIMFLSLTATGLAAGRTSDHHCVDRRPVLYNVPFPYSNWLGSLSDY